MKARVIANREGWGGVGHSPWRKENAGQVWGAASIISWLKVEKESMEHGEP